MNTDTLNRLTGEGEVASAAAMYVDPGELSARSRRLERTAGDRVGGHEGPYDRLLFSGKDCGLVRVLRC